MRLILSAALLASVVFVYGCGSSGTSSAYPFQIIEFSVPVAGNSPSSSHPGCWPDDLRSDTDGNLWFAQHHSNEVGRMSSNGVYTGYQVSTPNSVMDGILVDSPRNAVWATQSGASQIVRIDMRTGTVIEIPTPTSNAVPGDLALAPDGSIWFSAGYEDEGGTTRIARIDPANNHIDEFAPSTMRNGTDGIIVAKNGVVWFCEINDDRLGKYSNGQFTEYVLPRPNALPTNLAEDSQGRIWITEQAINSVAIFDPAASSWTEISFPEANSRPGGIIIDASDNVWTALPGSNRIGLIVHGTKKAVTFLIPTPNCRPEDICVTPQGRVYFTEQFGNKIGEIKVSGITPP